MYKKFLDHSNCSLYTQYKKYRNTLNRALQCAKRNYYSKILFQNKHDIGTIYERINEICKLKSKKRVFASRARNFNFTPLLSDMNFTKN